MSKNRDLNSGDIFPASWTDAIQEFIGTYVSPNFVVQQISTTAIKIAAGSDNDQVGISINGRWRYITSDINTSDPGGAAATHTIWVKASDNSFTNSPEPDTDETNYNFALEIRTGGTPSSALYRQIGTLVWDGSQITAIDISVGAQAGTARHASTHAATGTDPITPTITNTYANRPAVGTVPTGALFFSSDTKNLYRNNGTNWEVIGTQPGTLVAYGGSSVPTGWLLADGSAVSRTTYAELFAVFGTKYGTGNGSTTFNLPNLVNKAVYGDVTELTNRGNKSNESQGPDHTLTSSESGMPQHYHNMIGVNRGGTAPSAPPPTNTNGPNNQTLIGGAAVGGVPWDNTGYPGAPIATRGSDAAYSWGIGVGGVVGGAASASSAHNHGYIILPMMVKA